MPFLYRFHRLFSILLFVLSTAILVSLFASGLASSKNAPPPGEFTAEQCATCHEGVVNDFRNNPHIAIERLNIGGSSSEAFVCASCHGDPSTHLNEGGGKGNIFTFTTAKTSQASIERCQTCHSNAHPQFNASPHAQSGMDCMSCHTIHGNQTSEALLSDSETAICSDCHGDIQAKFSMNESHRLHEGILQCSSCHDPHQPQSTQRLAGFSDETCFKCHSDKQGPFMFEHGASQIEGCVSCHDPHGSPNRHMIKFQSEANLCYSCHGAVPGFHTRFTTETLCTNCHTTVHGSNLSPSFLK